MGSRSRTKKRRSSRLSGIFSGVFLAVVIAAGVYYVAKNRTLSDEEYFALATEHFAKNDYQATLIDLKNTLQENPKHVRARILAGQTHLQLDDGLSAEKEFQSALRLGAPPSSVSTPLLRARLLQGHFGEVIGTLVGRQQSSLTSEELVLRAQAHAGRTDYEKAKRDFKAALEIDPSNTFARQALTEAALAAGDTDEAQQQLANVQNDSGDSQNESSIETTVLAGELALKKRELDAAQSAFEAALQRDSTHLVARMGLVRTLLAKNQPVQALTHIDTLAAANPYSPVSNYLRGLALYLQENFEASQIELAKVLSVAPDHSQTLLLSGGIHYRFGELELAREKLSRHVDGTLANTNGKKLLGAVHLRLRQFDEAIAILLEVTSSNPKDAQALALLGSAQMSAGQHETATQTLSEAAQLRPDAAAIRTQLGLSHLAAGETVEGIESLRSATEMDAGFHRADYLLALVYLRQQKFDEAQGIVEKLRDEQPENPIPLNLLAATYEGKGDFSKARENYEAAIRLNPNYATAAMNLARLETAAGNTQAAEALYRNLLDGTPQATVHHQYAGFLHKQNRREEAAQQLHAAVALAPDSVPIGMDLARNQRLTGKNQDALRTLLGLQTIAPTSPAIRAALAETYFILGQFAEAADLFESLASANPSSVALLYQTGAAQLQATRTEAAYQTLRNVLKLQADHAGAKRLLAQLSLSQNDIETALSLAKEIQTDHPSSPQGWVLEGDLYLATQQFEKALTSYRSAMSMNEHTSTVIKIATIHRHQGAYEEANRVLRNWLAKHPNDAQVHLVLASAYQATGELERAEEHYEEVLRAVPSNAVALNNLAWIYHGRGDSKSLSLAAKAHEFVPENGAITDTYGWFLVLSGETEQGLAKLAQALTQAPENPDIRYHYAYGLVQSGDKQAARTELLAILGADTEFSERKAAENLLSQLE